MSAESPASALALLKALAEQLDLGARKRLTKGALVALETVQPRYLTKYGVAVLLGLDSERVVEDWISDKKEAEDGIEFPRPIEVTKRIHRWDLHEVLDFMERKKAKRAQRGGPF
ncbi:helix-turn-helix transcriptional regulator [Engelhardtia mirabilis]|uniref:Uncharacterized protein n=1 Tax=Engelhardtia mirabilis TaxID=2528011 RepID=A0A518BK28_9BACT|nr:hypothetical protein Pla133_24100 [Planctomycetes bacterium Pla133]QDV01655.1 hypothetical protein Pla86_24090 [Planctomycetes bacterium Pla86]